MRLSSQHLPKEPQITNLWVQFGLVDSLGYIYAKSTSREVLKHDHSLIFMKFIILAIFHHLFASRSHFDRFYNNFNEYISLPILPIFNDLVYWCILNVLVTKDESSVH